MGREGNGTDQYLRATDVPVNAFPYTISIWFKPDVASLGNNQWLVMLSDGVTDDYTGIMLENDEGVWGVVNNSSAGNGIAKTTTNPHTGADIWHHAVLVATNATTRKLYYDGVGSDVDIGGSVAISGTWDVTNLLRNEDADLHFDGSVGECAIWDTALTYLQCLDLSSGASPAAVDAANLVAHWQLKGTASPEPDRVGTLDLTVTGATDDDEPPVDEPDATPDAIDLLDSLVYSYEFDEAAATDDLVDAHTDGLDLTGTNDPGVASGKIAGARDFEFASNQYFEHADDTAFQIGDIDCCWDFWLNRESADSLPLPFSKDNGSSRSYLMYYSSGWHFQCSSGGALTDLAWFHAADTTRWYHIYIEHDATANTIGVSVDGGKLRTVTHAGGIQAGTAAFTIGNRASHDFPYDGLLDMFRCWKRKLNATEKKFVHNAGVGLAYADFVPAEGGIPYFANLAGGFDVLTGGIGA